MGALFPLNFQVELSLFIEEEICHSLLSDVQGPSPPSSDIDLSYLLEDDHSDQMDLAGSPTPRSPIRSSSDLQDAVQMQIFVRGV